MELTAEHLEVRFPGGERALGGVDAVFAQGSRVLVLGNASAGKTTLLKALAGLLPVTSGTVRWDGMDVARLGNAARVSAQAHFGFVFQTDALFDSLTVLDNVLLPLRKRRVPEAEAQRRAREVLDRVGLTAAAATLPERLSGGMRKRAGIARAIVAEPEVVFADDPLAGLDPHTAAQVCRLLAEVAATMTLLVGAVEPLPALPLPRWLVLDRGQVLHDGPERPELLAALEVDAARRGPDDDALGSLF